MDVCWLLGRQQKPRLRGAFVKRMKGLEPSTFWQGQCARRHERDLVEKDSVALRLRVTGRNGASRTDEGQLAHRGSVSRSLKTRS